MSFISILFTYFPFDVWLQAGCDVLQQLVTFLLPLGFDLFWAWGAWIIFKDFYSWFCHNFLSERGLFVNLAYGVYFVFQYTGRFSQTLCLPLRWTCLCFCCFVSYMHLCCDILLDSVDQARDKCKEVWQLRFDLASRIKSSTTVPTVDQGGHPVSASNRRNLEKEIIAWMHEACPCSSILDVGGSPLRNSQCVTIRPWDDACNAYRDKVALPSYSIPAACFVDQFDWALCGQSDYYLNEFEIASIVSKANFGAVLISRQYEPGVYKNAESIVYSDGNIVRMDTKGGTSYTHETWDWRTEQVYYYPTVVGNLYYTCLELGATDEGKVFWLARTSYRQGAKRLGRRPSLAVSNDCQILAGKYLVSSSGIVDSHPIYRAAAKCLFIESKTVLHQFLTTLLHQADLSFSHFRGMWDTCSRLHDMWRRLPIPHYWDISDVKSFAPHLQPPPSFDHHHDGVSHDANPKQCRVSRGGEVGTTPPSDEHHPISPQDAVEYDPFSSNQGRRSWESYFYEDDTIHDMEEKIRGGNLNRGDCKTICKQMAGAIPPTTVFDAQAGPEKPPDAERRGDPVLHEVRDGVHGPPQHHNAQGPVPRQAGPGNQRNRGANPQGRNRQRAKPQRARR
jgi:hypothetical protein